METPLLPPPLVLPDTGDRPVLLSVAHAGRIYPRWLVDLAATDLAGLQSLEDPYVDRLIWRAVRHSGGAVIAQAPRAAIDCNRALDDVDGAIVSGAPECPPRGRAAHGLGLVPARSQRSGRIWRRPLQPAELEARVDSAYTPFHRAIEQALDRLSVRHGSVLLLDCHSMPPRRGQAELVIGDRHGRSCSRWLVAKAAEIARSAGWSVAINDPYAGGETLARHGSPEYGRHALQLEIDRNAYLAPDLRSPGSGFDRAAQLLKQLTVKLGDALLRTQAVAAE